MKKKHKEEDFRNQNKSQIQKFQELKNFNNVMKTFNPG